MDAFGIVNNIVYFRYLESGEFIGSVAGCAEPGSADRAAGEWCRVIHHSVQLGRSSPDHLVVSSCRVAESDRVTLAHDIWSEQQRIVAEGEGVIVAYDHEAGVGSGYSGWDRCTHPDAQTSGNAGGPDRYAEDHGHQPIPRWILAD